MDCGGEPVPTNNAVYCPAGDFIAYDVNFAVRAFERIGDAFIYYLLGHEYGHGIQVRLGIQYQYTIEQELQADFAASAYIGDMIRAGALKLEPGDLEEFRDGLLAVGDDPSVPWFTPGAHGTAEQRTSAFFKGTGIAGRLRPAPERPDLLPPAEHPPQHQEAHERRHQVGHGQRHQLDDPWRSRRRPPRAPRALHLVSASPMPKTTRPWRWSRAVPRTPKVSRRLAAVLATAVIREAARFAACA